LAFVQTILKCVFISERIKIFTFTVYEIAVSMRVKCKDKSLSMVMNLSAGIHSLKSEKKYRRNSKEIKELLWLQ